MMTDAKLENLLQSLNSTNNRNLVFLTPISSLVDYGKVWETKPSSQLAGYEPEKIYCIKNKEGTYVAAVLYSQPENLHWLVLNQHRRQGYLAKALKNSILPHIFLHKKFQRLVLSKHIIEEPFFTANLKIALKAGFTVTQSTADATALVVCCKNNANQNCIKQVTTQFTKERIVELKKQINFISQSLLLVQTEIEVKTGISKYTEKLKHLSQEIYGNMDRLDTACFYNEATLNN